jgi:hypothetical protein
MAPVSVPSALTFELLGKCSVGDIFCYDCMITNIDRSQKRAQRLCIFPMAPCLFPSSCP